MSFSPAGGQGMLRVTTNRECAWSAEVEAGWVSLTAPVSGQGDGDVRFTVAPNADPSNRNADIRIEAQQIRITQEGRPCEFAVSSSVEAIGAAGGEREIQVTASSGACQWTAVSNVSWITVVSGGQGAGNGTVVFRADAVAGPQRVGTLTIAGHRVQVEQGTGCSVTVPTTVFTIDSAGGNLTIPVSAPPGCTWSAESQLDWITITEGSNGEGSREVRISVGPSTIPARTGTVRIAGQTVTINQGSGCTFAVAPPNISMGSGGGPATVQVTSAAGCGWSAASGAPWVTVATGGSGSGPGQVQLAIAANTGPARDTTVSVAGSIVRVSQASGCTYGVSPTEQDVAGTGGSASVSLSTASGCAWSANSSVPWIAIQSASGTGSARVAFAVEANPGPQRTGTIAVAGQVVTVNQASSCSWTFAPASHELGPNGGNGNVLVIVSGPCVWTAASDVPWIRLTAGSSGTGNGLVQFVVEPSGVERTGSLTIAGQRYEVTQK